MKRAFKVLVTGTHSTGKSTLVGELARKVSLTDSTVLPESARDCPFTLNREQNDISTAWLLAAQLLTETDYQTRLNVRWLICDRGLPDILAYHQVATGNTPPWMDALAAEWMPSYDLVLLARPDPGRFMQPDALRLADRRFQAEVQAAIEERLTTTGVNHSLLPHDFNGRIALVREILANSGVSA